MQVFKLFFKLIKNKSTPLIVITVMFLLYLFIFMDKGNYSQKENEDVNIAVIDYNKNDVFGEQLKSILNDYAVIYNYSDEEEVIEDKIVSLNIDAIITIPYEFSKDLMDGKRIVIEYQNITNNRLLEYVEDIINLYISTTQIYIKDTEVSTTDTILSLMTNTFKTTGEYKQLGQRNTLINYEVYDKYFRIAAYVIFTVCLIGTGMALHSFQNIHIQRRNLMSPFPVRVRNLQMFFGNLIFVILYVIFLVLVSFLYYEPPYMDKYLFLYWLNLLVFSISGLFMSYLMTMLTKKRDINILLALLIPLVLCSISGVFISQSEISETVLNIAYFTPTYWFVKGNTMIMNSAYGQIRVLSIAPIILVQSLFGVAFFCISLVVSKENRNKT